LADYRHLVWLVAIPVGGCGEMAGFEALVGCSERLEAVFPEARQMSSDDTGDATKKPWDVRPDGTFVFDLPASDGSKLWRCTGSTKSRTIAEIEYKGVVKRPPANASWSY